MLTNIRCDTFSHLTYINSEMIEQMEFIKRFFQHEKAIEWETVFVSEFPKIFNYFRFHGLCYDDADDLTAVVFEKAWSARDRYRSTQASVATWLISIARNLLVDHLRKQRAEISLDCTENPARSITYDQDIEENIQQHEDTEVLRKLLSRLPERERELVALKYGAEMTNRAIASTMGLSESNIGTILNRVVIRLREQWEARR